MSLLFTLRETDQASDAHMHTCARAHSHTPSHSQHLSLSHTHTHTHTHTYTLLQMDGSQRYIMDDVFGGSEV